MPFEAGRDATAADTSTWVLRPRRRPALASTAAAALLAVLGGVVGGPLGWVAFVFFAVAAVALGASLVTAEPRVRIDGRQLTIADRRGADATLAWPEVAGIVVWTRMDQADGRPVDLFGVLGAQQVAAAADVTDAPPRPDAALAASVALRECVLDVEQLRAALGRVGCQVPVVDRRQQGTRRQRRSRRRQGTRQALAPSVQAGNRPSARSATSAIWRGRSRPRS
jgi:hypothetical protein